MLDANEREHDGRTPVPMAEDLNKAIPTS